MAEVLDSVLAKVGYEVIELLRAFKAEGSFQKVAQRFGKDERTVSKALNDLDDAFFVTRQVHILARGPRSYRLTQEGEVFLALLEEVAVATVSAVEGVTSASSRVPLPCTSNCLGYFRRLREALPNGDFDILPVPRRTAELDISSGTQTDTSGFSTETYPISLMSALMSSDQAPMRGEVVQFNGDFEVLILGLDHLRLLANENLGFGAVVTVKEVVDSGVTLLVPGGGVAWEFLARNYPGWNRLRPFQHIAVPHLDYGLRCLSDRLVPRSAMVVHGVTIPSPGLPKLDDCHSHAFAEGPYSYLAVTGLFRNKTALSHLSLDQIQPYETIWDTALGALAEKDRLF